jgi:hypothetical protein
MAAMGISAGPAPVVTNRTVPFLDAPPNDGPLLIADDIVVFGTALDELVGTLRARFPKSRVVLLPFARNKDWHQPALAPISACLLPLDSRDSAVFCDEVVQALAYLDKPYDLDHSIWYTSLGLEDLIARCHSRGVDHFHELTTVFQAQVRRRRGSFLQSPRTAGNFVHRLFAARVGARVGLAKLRVYAAQDGTVTLVPILTFRLLRPPARGERVFSSAFDSLQRCYEAVLAAAPAALDEKSRYALVWYLASVAWGAAFAVRNGLQRHEVARRCTGWPLAVQDAQLLFGIRCAGVMEEALKGAWDELLAACGAGAEKRVARVPGPAAGAAGVGETGAGDGCRAQWSKRISEYLNRYLTPDRTFLANLATVFQAMYLRIELPYRAREAGRLASGRQPSRRGWRQRLDKGFSTAQLLRLLLERGVRPPRGAAGSVVFSLSVDYLVDRGIMVPRFVCDQASWRREWSFGETAPAFPENTLTHIVGSVCRAGLDQASRAPRRRTPRRELSSVRSPEQPTLPHLVPEPSISDLLPRLALGGPRCRAGSLPQVDLEKVLWVIGEQLRRRFYQLQLPSPETDLADQFLVPAPDWLLHGAVTDVRPWPGDRRRPRERRVLFTEWAESRGIVRREGGGYVWDGAFARANTPAEASVPKGFQSELNLLARCLVALRTGLGSANGSPLLVQIATCHNQRAAMTAAQRDLMLSVGAATGEYSLTRAAQLVRQACAGSVEPATARRAAALSRSAIDAARWKLLKWKQWPSARTEIEAFFRRLEGGPAAILLDAYQAVFSAVLDALQDVWCASPSEAALLVERLDLLGQGGFVLARILEAVCCKLDPGHPASVSRAAPDLTQVCGAWADFGTAYYNAFAAPLPAPPMNVSPGEASDRLSELLDAAHENAQCLRRRLCGAYADDPFERKMAELFPPYEELQDVFLLAWDIKRSRGERTATGAAKQAIEKRLWELRNAQQVLRHRLKGDDAGFAAVKEGAAVHQALVGLSVAARPTFLRLAVVHTKDSGFPLRWYPEAQALESEPNFIAVTTLRDYGKDLMPPGEHTLTYSREVKQVFWPGVDLGESLWVRVDREWPAYRYHFRKPADLPSPGAPAGS